MDAATRVSFSDSNSFVALTNHNLQPHYAKVYDIPERPRIPAPKIPLLRYEDSPTTDGSDPDEEYCLTGYGETTISDHYGAGDPGEVEQKRRVPRLRNTRPRSKHQTEADPDPLGTSGSDGPGESLLTADAGQLEPEYFRNVIKERSAGRPTTPNMDFRAFFENLRNNSQTRRQRTLILQNSPASEAIDARPRSN